MLQLNCGNIELSYLIQNKEVDRLETKKIKLGVPNKEGQLSMMFTKGGPREGAGRKGFGDTKKISLTLSKALWEILEQRCTALDSSRSEVIRDIIEDFFSTDTEKKDVTSFAD
jgi:hypothetical protein